MLIKETKKRIDDARDILVGVLPLPSDQVELITIAMIYKFMDDQDEELLNLGFEESFFTGNLKEYSWKNLVSNQLSADQRVELFAKAIDAIAKAPNIPLLFKNIFTNRFLKFRNGQILKRFLDNINEFKYEHSEELGNAFEYLLMTMGTQGANGQFRTPRHIIDFIVEVVDPELGDKILDPACGTGGFLISAVKHILRKNTEGYEDYRLSLNNHDVEGKAIKWGDKLTNLQKDKLGKSIVGYDITPMMVMLSQVNLYLHQFKSPEIHEYDTLSNNARWKDKFDTILANPPFMTPKGGVKAHDQFYIQSPKAEILFSDYIIEHLTQTGKAGFIIPEGVIFTNSEHYVKLRKWLVETAGLWAVVSLPGQIFQPYSGVKTSIIFVDRKIARERADILLLKIDNDGFELNTNRKPIRKNDLPEALSLLEQCKSNFENFKNQDTSQAKVKYQLLHRDEFKRLDAYKATTVAFDVLRKQYEKTIKAKEEYEVIKPQILKEKQAEFLLTAGFKVFPQSETDLKKQFDNQKDSKITFETLKKLYSKILKAKDDYETKDLETWQKVENEFLTFTNLTELPDSVETLKTWYNEDWKQKAIDYGTHLLDCDLPDLIKKELDEWREYNLNFDKYTESKIQGISKYDKVRLSDILEIQNGFAFKSEYFNDEMIGVPIMRIRDLKNGQSNTYYCGNDYSDDYFVNEGDILIGMDGDFVAFRWGKTPTLLNQRICRLRNFKNALPEYVYRMLNVELRAIEEKTFGVTVKHISHKQIESIEIPLPPLSIQEQIVTEIDRCQKVIDGCQLVVDNYALQFEENEEWAYMRLSEVTKLISDGDHLAPPKAEEGIPFITISNIKNNTINFSDTKFVPEEYYDSLKHSRKPQKNDVLYTVTGSYGIPVFLDKDIKFCFQRHIALLRPNEKINPKYLYYFMKSTKTFEKATNVATGVAQLTVPLDGLRNLEIPLPPLSIQDQIVTELERERAFIDGAKAMRIKMEDKIREVIGHLWGKEEKE